MALYEAVICDLNCNFFCGGGGGVILVHFSSPEEYYLGMIWIRVLVPLNLMVCY